MLAKKIIQKVHKVFHPVVGEIWCLHRVTPNRSLYPSNRELEITPEYLEKLICDYKSQGYSFENIDAIVSSLARRKARKQVNISFDDGFADIYTYAFPIFKKYNIPFTIYLTTDMPDGKADLWWIQLEHYCSEDVEMFESIMRQCYDSREPMADVMHRLTTSSPQTELSREFSLTWNQINEMVASGLCTLGSHTLSHPGLTRIPKEQMRKELEESRKNILQRFPLLSVNHFSYPHSMHDPNIRDSVAACGYQSAVLGYGGSIHYGGNNYMLYRNYIVQK